MISNENLGGLVGAPVMGPDDDRFGTVGQVFVDPITGRPNWVTVKTGLFGRHETFVPLDQATWDREVLHVPYEKDLVKDAPRIDTDEALDPESEQDLYLYYGIGDDDGSRESDRRADDDTDGAEHTRLRRYQTGEEEQAPVPVREERSEPAVDSDAGSTSPESDGEARSGPKHRA